MTTGGGAWARAPGRGIRVHNVHMRPMQEDHQRAGAYGYIGLDTKDFVVMSGAPMDVD